MGPLQQQPSCNGGGITNAVQKRTDGLQNAMASRVAACSPRESAPCRLVDMDISADHVAAFLKCPTKCFLRAHGEVGTGNAYSDWVRAQNDVFRREGTKLLVAGVATDKCATGTPPVETERLARWQWATDFQARSANLQSSCHAVERIPSVGGRRVAQLIPIRFVFNNRLTRDEKLLLAFDAHVISKAFNREVALGRIIYGDDQATLDVKTSALIAEVEKLADKIAVLISSPSPPDLVLNRHCVECEFQTRCRQKAIEKDDLSLLGGLTAKQRADLNSRGIFTVTQLSFTFRPRRRAEHLKDKREKYHYSLRALAIRQRKVHVVGSPEIKIEGTPVYFDVESLPDRGFYYLIGIRIKTHDSVVHHSLWADGPSDEGSIWQGFLSRLAQIENPVLIHYGSFESIFLKRMCDKYGGPPDGSAAAKACKSPVNLLSVIFAQIYFPTYSNGLKEIAGCLGFRWSGRDASGVQSIVWRHEWERTKAPSLKEKLISYNSEDCAALALVEGAVVQACRKGIEPAPGPAGHLEVVVADKLDSKVTMWPKFSTTIEGFEAINEAARWDYQRDRVYIRTDTELKHAKRKRQGRAKRAPDISKTVVCEPFRFCPRCQRRGTQTFRTITKLLRDLRFSKSGVTGWVVKYQFQVFWCPTCRAFTPWPKEFWDRTTYGRNLAAYSIFEIVELCVSQRSVTEGLNRLFGFQMDEIVVRRFKERGAEYYRETRKSILAEMVRGSVIHADETRIRLHGKIAYVWVFTTLRQVVYFYSETREGSLAQSALEGFKGVLVSDFYAAYDSIPCAQQKCLIHLMRDLNDDVLDNPYDESLKGIASAFAELLTGIVKTIDRRGLKSRFLRKHLVEVVRFYRRISKAAELSAAALKWRARLEKDREKLFTFLSHDGVPWNNNNAEHAIKAFARLRRTIEGLSTPKGIEEYLILLSVCQTCKYSGLDFLKFLRSGEIDIDTFATSQQYRSRPIGRA
jgi:predicted RecB family nuclease